MSSIKLDFREQAALYLGRHVYTLSEEEREFVFSASKEIHPPPSELYVIVPFFFQERGLHLLLDLLSAQIKRAGGSLIIFLNGNSRDSFNQYECKRNEAFQLTQAYREAAQWNNISLIHYYMSKNESGMGRVRGLITDAVLLNALNSKYQNPLIMYIDSDTLQISPRLIESHVSALSPADPTTLMSAGPINYGYIDTEPVGLPPGLHVPELYIFNQLNSAILSCARVGEINYERRIYAEGGNMAVAASGYCACGGFDFSIASGEDDALGRAMHRFNPNCYLAREVVSDVIYERDPAYRLAFSEDAWIVTDPRRILAAIAENYPGIEAWADRAFMDNPGAGIETSVFANRCNCDHRLINVARLLAAGEEADSGPARQFIMARLKNLLFRSLRYDKRARDDDQMRRVLLRLGVIFREGTAELLEEREISWSESLLIHSLLAMARCADSPFRKLR